MRRGGGDGVQEYIVVTLLVAAAGKLELPKIQSQEQLVTALNRLAALREDQASRHHTPPLACILLPSFLASGHARGDVCSPPAEHQGGWHACTCAGDGCGGAVDAGG